MLLSFFFSYVIVEGSVSYNPSNGHELCKGIILFACVVQRIPFIQNYSNGRLLSHSLSFLFLYLSLHLFIHADIFIAIMIFSPSSHSRFETIQITVLNF